MRFTGNETNSRNSFILGFEKQFRNISVKSHTSLEKFERISALCCGFSENIQVVEGYPLRIGHRFGREKCLLRA